MSFLLAPVVEIYRLILQPVAPFTWFGLQLSTLDVVAAFRLCVALRQIREKLWRDHVLRTKTVSANEKDGAKNTITQIETRSFVRDAAAALVVVYGGEALTGPYRHDPLDLCGLRRTCSSGTGDPTLIHAFRSGARVLHGYPGGSGEAALGSSSVFRAGITPCRVGQLQPCIPFVQPYPAHGYAAYVSHNQRQPLDPPPHLAGTSYHSFHACN